MSLRHRIAGVILFTMVCVSGVFLGVRHLVVIPGLQALEVAEAKEHAVRCVHAIDTELEHLSTFCFDWSAWDDTYTYVAAPDEAYESSNLSLPTFTDNEINLIYILDREGDVVWSGIYDLDTEGALALSQFPQVHWSATNPLLGHDSPESCLRGIMATDRGPMLVASRPILTTGSEGPSRGTFIMGKFADHAFIEHLANQTLLDVAVWPVAGRGVPFEERSVLSELEENGEEPFCREVDAERMAVYMTYPGIFGGDALLIRAMMDRDILGAGQRILSIMRTSFVAASLVILSLIILLTRNLVVRPITRLTEHVTGVARSDDLALLPAVADGSEIGVLTREFNLMVRRLQHENTERKAAEAAVQEREARLQAILDAAPDGVLIIDGGGRVESINPAGRRLFGLEGEGDEGVGVDELMPGLFSIRREAAGGDEGSETGAGNVVLAALEGTGVRKDGTSFLVHVNMNRIETESSGRYTVIVRDITKLREMDERLKRAEHFVSLGDMGATMAHEIRNPLACISSALQVLRERPQDAAESSEIIDEVLGQVARVDEIVRRLLVFARSQNASKERCDLRRLVERVVSDAGEKAGFEGIAFELEGEPILMAQVDRFLLEQVLWNLLQNAVDAYRQRTGEGPPKNGVWITFSRRADMACIVVKDEAGGMAPEVEARLFKPFYTTKTYGTGLGLVICREIVEFHGGRMSICSQRGQGTTVEVELPLGGEA